MITTQQTTLPGWVTVAELAREHKVTESAVLHWLRRHPTAHIQLGKSKLIPLETAQRYKPRGKSG